MGLSRVEPYRFDAGYERAVVTRSCASTKFWGTLGQFLEPDALGADEAKLAMTAAHAIFRETGAPPSGLRVVCQRLRRMTSDGKVTLERIMAAVTYLSGSVPEKDEALVAEAVPMLRQRLSVTMAVDFASGVAKGVDTKAVRKQLNTIEKVGVASAVSVQMTSTSTIADRFAADAAKHREYLRTGILDLDDKLGGGMPRGALGFYLGHTGGGKTMALSQLAATAVWDNRVVAYVSLEMRTSQIDQRILACLTGVPTRRMEHDQAAVEQAVRRLSKLEHRVGHELGWLTTYMEPNLTTVEDVTEWVDQAEQATSKQVDLLIVDYADRLHLRGQGKEARNHDVLTRIYEDLRSFVAREEHPIWGFTASQATRGGDNAVLDEHRAAGSAGKARTADLVVSLNPNYVDLTMKLFVVKHRTGEGHGTSIVPMDLSCSRLGEVQW